MDHVELKNILATKNLLELGDGYHLRLLDGVEFGKIFDEFYPVVFGDKLRFNPRDIYSSDEEVKIQSLREGTSNALTIRLGIFRDNEIVGWSVADQKTAEEIYMRNTGILQQHQGKGVYTSFIKKFIEISKTLGFQIISSYHNATNNRVMIAKMKTGFLITGFNLSDRFGVMVRLEYFINPKRRQILEFRAGDRMPNSNIKEVLNF